MIAQWKATARSQGVGGGVRQLRFHRLLQSDESRKDQGSAAEELFAHVEERRVRIVQCEFDPRPTFRRHATFFPM